MRGSFIRYPGGKSKHTDKILKYFWQETEYREPFIGGGSVYLKSEYKQSWINDVDPGVYDLWRMVKEEPNTLIDLIEEHTPVLEHQGNSRAIETALALWREIKDDNGTKFSLGYRLLFLNKTCFSGVISGGPTGGIEQKSEYTIAARWAKKMTIARIKAAHSLLQDCEITNQSYEEIVTAPGEDVAIYLDPPYLKKGSQCYDYYFTLEDHCKLAEMVVNCPHRYVVTVDNCPEIQTIWSELGVPGERMRTEEWSYSMTDRRDSNRVGKELFICDEHSNTIFLHKHAKPKRRISTMKECL